MVHIATRTTTAFFLHVQNVILRENCVLKHVFEGKIEGMRRRGRRCRQLLDDMKEKRIPPSYWKRRWTCGKTDSKMDGRERLRKSAGISTDPSLGERAVGLSHLPTAILRRGKIINFESNTTCILSKMGGLHVSDESANLSSDTQYKTNSKGM